MKRKTRRAVIGTIVGLALLCLGASNPLEKLTLTPTNPESMRSRVEALEKQNAALQQQVADLNRKVNALSQRVNAGCGGGDVGAFNSDGANSSYLKEAPGLSVVRLQPENKAPGSLTVEEPKGRLLVESSSAEPSPVMTQPLPGTGYVPLPDPALTMTPGSTATLSDAKGPASPAAPPAAMASPALGPGKAAPSANEVAAYDEIRALVAQSKLDEARPLLEAYLQKYPGGSHEAEVANWLGMNQFTAGNYDRAIDSLKLVTEKHFESAVAPDALYILGLCYFEQGKLKEAANTFRDVKTLYPFSKAAQLAETKLAACDQ